MDQEQQNAAPMPAPETPVETTPAAVAAPVTAPAPVVDTGVKSYINLVSLAFFAAPTGLARAYRGEQIGWVRFWVYVGATILMAVPILNFLAILAMLVLGVWGAVDFFLIHKLRTDASGQPLHATARDQVWAKNMKTVYIVLLALAAVLIVLAILIVAAGIANFSNYSNSSFDPSSFERFDSSLFDY